MDFTVINDPIHGQITLSELEKRILDSLPMQRLRYIKQMTGTSFVFPTAQHTRFDHSLGVMHVAGLYAEQLFPEDKERTEALRLAGLLHDVGHGPYSHQFDDTIYQEVYPGEGHGHDLQRLKIIKMLDIPFASDIERIFDGRDVIDKALLQGAIGADRVDFLLRDSYFTGTSFSMVPVNRIVLNTGIFTDEDDGQEKLAVNWKIMDDLFSSLIGRFMMFKNVYFHKTARGIDLLLQDLLSIASEDLNLIERTANIENFIELTEPALLGEILSLDNNHPAKKLARDIFYNKGWLKMVFEKVLPTEMVHQISQGTDFSLLTAKNKIGSQNERFSLVCRNIAMNEFINPVKVHLDESIKLRPDNAYQMSFFDPIEFDFYDVRVYDPKNRIGNKLLLPFSKAVKNMAYARFLRHVREFSLVRVYCQGKDRKKVMEAWKKARDLNKNDNKKVDTSY
ncbi:MAG: HD domain-containing protein [Candidatus Hodarchaeales archaeon]